MAMLSLEGEASSSLTYCCYLLVHVQAHLVPLLAGESL